MLVALALALAHTQGSVVAISRGGPGDGQFLAWGVEDTFIDGEMPDTNYGRDALLSSGLQRTILIKFSDLDRLVPQGKRVKSARLLMRIEIGKTVALRDINRMLVPWGEGPDKRGFRLKPKVDPKDPKPKKDLGPAWSATWKMRRAGEGGIGWQQSGAAGVADQAPISGAAAQMEGDWVVITGLGPAVQQMVDSPTENFGFGIRFDSNLDLTSSDNATGRPRLEVELEDAPPASGFDLSVNEIVWNAGNASWPANGQEVTWTATVVNQGSQPCPGFTAQWSYRERRLSEEMISKPLAPGESTTVKVTMPWRSAPDPRMTPLSLKLDTGGKDVSPRNNGLTTWTAAQPISVPFAQAESEATKRGYASAADYLQGVLRFFNEVALPQSKFSFAPEGGHERFRLQSTNAFIQADLAQANGLRSTIVALARAAGLPDWRTVSSHAASDSPLAVEGVNVWRGTSDLFPGMLGGGDTRDEAQYFPTLSMQYEPWVDPQVDAQPMPPSDLFAATDIAFFNKKLGAIGADRLAISNLFPRTPLVRAMDAGGRPLVGMTLDFFPVSNGAVGAKAFTAKTGNQGIADLPAQPGAWTPGLYLVRTSAHGVTEWAWLKSWQIMEEAARGSAILNLRFALPASPMDAATNLMKNKIVTDSVNSLPAKLAPLVDDSVETLAELDLKQDDWVEIDLGRDRPLAEVRFVTPAGSGAWPKFDIYVYATGQRAGEARLWTQERNTAWTLVNRRDIDPKEPGLVSVAYRGSLTRARFVRIVVRESAGPVRIAELRAAPLTFDPGG